MTTRLGRKPTDADYGLGKHAIDGDRMGLVGEQELTERLIRTFSSPGYQPPRLPAVAMELVTLSQNLDVEFSAIETLLEQDAMLAGEVLSLARSAVYSGTRKVGNLREALVRVGLTRLRRIVMEAAMNLRVFRSAAYAGCMERLRLHCQATAHLCRIVSRYSPMDEDQAFLCGLLHDVGIAGTLLILGDVKRGEKPPDLAVMWPAIDAAHAQAGTCMVKLWGLPAETAMVVGAHHQVSIDGYDHPMAAVVCLAEALALELELGLVPGSEEQDPGGVLEKSGLTIHGRIDHSDAAVIQRARDALGCDESTVELMLSDARAWIEAEAAGSSRS